jgi:2-dehydro-3-deoxyphosphooctonate aldolase (KDO 8-P synthase)
MDATHAVQPPGDLGGAWGWQREFAPALARVAAAVGVAADFLVTHPDPDRVQSDEPNMVLLAAMGRLVERLKATSRRRPEAGRA